jgi:hypothetical protein
VASFIVRGSGTFVVAEGRLSTLDAHRGDGDPRRPARRRVRALAACVGLAIVLHVALLDGFAGPAAPPPDATRSPLSVRTIVVEPTAPPAAVEPPAPRAVVETTASSLPAPAPTPERPRRPPRSHPPEPMRASPELIEASAGSPAIDVSVAATANIELAAGNPVEAAKATSTAAAPQSISAGAAAANAIPGAGETPPPVYPARLPPAATLHYQVRRGFLQGDGQIRWRPAGDAYRLVLEASIAGLTLLVQTSEGAIDRHGLAPVRFLDQRARRAAQAANFVRENGRITFSGTAVEFSLVVGVQDRLSWMIQLAGIVAADPALLHDGARITMAVVGARGDADVWSLRYVGQETVETPGGKVAAFKLIREGHAPNDTTAEVWLDPARSYLPVRATLGNSSGSPEYDLLLSRIDP